MTWFLGGMAILADKIYERKKKKKAAKEKSRLDSLKKKALDAEGSGDYKTAANYWQQRTNSNNSSTRSDSKHKEIDCLKKAGLHKRAKRVHDEYYIS